MQHLRNDFLRRCELLRRSGFPLLDDIGDFIGRGFADVGLEAFQVLPGGKLLSLLTGAKSEYREGDRQHHFSLPTVERLIGELEFCQVKLRSLTRVDEREWCGDFELPSGELRRYTGTELLMLLMEVYEDVAALSK